MVPPPPRFRAPPHPLLQYEASGYPQSLLSGPIKPPATANETLSNKPLVQRFYRKLVRFGAACRELSAHAAPRPRSETLF